MPTENGYTTFDFLGQKRYRCRLKQQSGVACPWDTYSLDLMREHERGHHKQRDGMLDAAEAMPLLFTETGDAVTRDPDVPGEYRSYKFKEEKRK